MTKLNRKISGEAVGLHDTCKTALDERGRNIEEGTGKKLAVEEIRMQRCKCGVTKLDRVRHGTKGGTESGRNRKESPREGGGTGAGMVKREDHYLGRRWWKWKYNYVRRKRGRPNRRWLDRVRGYINENGRSGRECTIQVHGHVGPISSDNVP